MDDKAIGDRIAAGWQAAFDLLVDSGIPSSLLVHMCISPDEATVLAGVIASRRPRRLLEVGTFVGLSTAVLALAAPRDATITCVDPDLPVRLQANSDAYRARVVDEARYEDDATSLGLVRRVVDTFGVADRVTLVRGFYSCPAQEGFARQLEREGVDACTIPIAGPALVGADPFDLAFIDGDHHTAAIHSDLLLCSRQLADNGAMIVHDVSGDWGQQVCDGVRRFLHDNSSFQFTTDNNLGFVEFR